MKTRNSSIRNMVLVAALALGGLSFGAYAQNSVPAPGTGGDFTPNGMPIGGPGPVVGGSGLNLTPNYQGPAPAPGSGVYNPGPGVPPPAPNPGPSPIIVNTPPLSNPDWQNNGVMNVVACGYDAQGVWQTIPMTVSYNYNGVQYNVTVLSAYNPWTQTWNRGIDDPAFNTSYFINGNTYNFYVNLSTGTYYFNL